MIPPFPGIVLGWGAGWVCQLIPQTAGFPLQPAPQRCSPACNEVGGSPKLEEAYLKAVLFKIIPNTTCTCPGCISSKTWSLEICPGQG